MSSIRPPSFFARISALVSRGTEVPRTVSLERGWSVSGGLVNRVISPSWRTIFMFHRRTLSSRGRAAARRRAGTHPGAARAGCTTPDR